MKEKLCIVRLARAELRRVLLPEEYRRSFMKLIIDVLYAQVATFLRHISVDSWVHRNFLGRPTVSEVFKSQPSTF